MRLYQPRRTTRRCSAAPRRSWRSRWPAGRPARNSAARAASRSRTPLENTDRNTVTTAPAAELAVQLYRITGNAQYLQFAEQAYEWVRACLLAAERPVRRPHQPARRGRTDALELQPGRDDRRRHAALPGDRQLRPTSTRPARPPRRRSPTSPRNGSAPRTRSSRRSTSATCSTSTRVTHDPPGPKLAQAYVDYAWQHLRLGNDLFVAGSPPSGAAARAGRDRADLRAAVIAAEHLLLGRGRPGARARGAGRATEAVGSGSDAKRPT